MGPVNWTAVIAAWIVSAILVALLTGGAKPPATAPVRHVVAALLLLMSASMMGHMFARVGAATLGAKPWLYFMMSGGLALAFVGPAMFATYTRRGAALKTALNDYGVWMIAYLAMGAVFWALG